MKKLLSKIKPSLKMIGLIFLVAFAFIFAMFQGGFVSWFIFYSFLPFVLYSIVLFVYPIQEFRVERVQGKKKFKTGERATVEITITRKTYFPLFYLLVEDKLPERLEQHIDGTKKKMVFPWFKRRITLSYSLENMPRGEHSFQEIRLKTGDFLGLFDKEAFFELPGRLLVYPAYKELSYRQLDNLFDQGRAGTANRLQRENSIVSGIREYQPGDQLSWINWKATARKNDIMTKEFEEMKSHDIFLIVDESPAEEFEAMVTYAASFVHSISKKGIQIGFYRTGKSGEVLPVRGGALQRQKIFYNLAKAEANAFIPIEGIIEKHSAIVPSNAAMAIITGRLTLQSFEWIGRFKTNQALTIFSVNRDSSLSKEEIVAREFAKTKGINVKYIEKGFFEGEISEVIAQ
ncbi:DUF58 domain-containing protein [Bacillus sp. V59.32b]|uniref:DUF58 domain-containing protein n=1 Tax=Bacillus sp. V59.32b TaxID=1758642 RepID=UPI000E3C4AD3|nr:DUF58 domain-containing protein [Bacillus sp. V59.32b]RFU64457.1 DUF58 domain-containing protein [Bacillus sp. V59.32b]